MKVLVLGGGIAGIETAIKLSERNLEVILVEKEARLGGRLKGFNSIMGLKEKPKEYIQRKIEALERHPKVEIVTRATIVGLQGTVGKFRANIMRETENFLVHVEAIVIAIGLQTIFCPVKYNLGISEKVTSQLRFEQQLTEGKNYKGKIITFILGHSTENHLVSYIYALHKAIYLKERYNSEVNIFYNNMKVASEELEDIYNKARVIGVNFFVHNNNLNFANIQNGVSICCKDPFLEPEIVNNYQVISDLIILPEEMFPNEDTERLGQIFGFSNSEEFYLGYDNIHYLPYQTRRPGIFTVGSCRQSSSFQEILYDSEIVAGEIYYRLNRAKLSEVEKEKGPQEKQSKDSSIVALCCKKSGAIAAEIAFKENLELEKILTIEYLSCSGVVDEKYLLDLLEKFKGVIIFACQKENCKFITGNLSAHNKVNSCKKILDKAGIEAERIFICNISANMGYIFVEQIENFQKRIGALANW